MHRAAQRDRPRGAGCRPSELDIGIHFFFLLGLPPSPNHPFGRQPAGGLTMCPRHSTPSALHCSPPGARMVTPGCRPRVLIMFL